jgi:hypothetical protein
MISCSHRILSGVAVAATLMAGNVYAQNKPVQTKNGSASVTYVDTAPAPSPKPAAPATPAKPASTVAQTQNPAQPAAPAQSASPAQPDKPAPPEIKDQAEYNTYANALGQANPQIQAAQLEAYLQLYPNSVVKEDALTALLQAYQKANDAPHMADAAGRLLTINPRNVTALALMAYNQRNKVINGSQDPNDAVLALQYGTRGLDALQTWKKPDPKMSDADFQNQKAQLSGIFYAASGLGSLNAKDYSAAQKSLQAAVDIGPNDLTNVYYLALAYLTPKPLNPAGLWYAARAVNLSNNNKQIYDYGHNKYLRFHSPDKSDDHWDDVVRAAAQPQPPAGFVIAPAPTDKEISAKMAANLDPKKITLGELEYIFLYADPQVSQDALAKMKGEELAFQANVIEVSPEKLMLAATEDAITSGKADVELTMVEAIPAKYLPKAGTQTVVVGQISGFQANPFMIQLNEGKLAAKPEPPKKPTHPVKRPVRRR